MSTNEKLKPPNDDSKNKDDSYKADENVDEDEEYDPREHQVRYY